MRFNSTTYLSAVLLPIGYAMKVRTFKFVIIFKSHVFTLKTNSRVFQAPLDFFIP